MASLQNVEIEGEIHHFVHDPKQGIIHEDSDGEVLEGWYYRFVKVGTDEPVCGYYGPYGDNKETEKACQQAWEDGDY